MTLQTFSFRIKRFCLQWASVRHTNVNIVWYPSRQLGIRSKMPPELPLE